MRLTTEAADAQAGALAALLAGGQLRILAGRDELAAIALGAARISGGVIRFELMTGYASKGGLPTSWQMTSASGQRVLDGAPGEIGLDGEIPADAFIRVAGLTYTVPRG